MAERLTDSIVRSLEVPEKGNRLTYDAEVKGFGARVTAAGARSFILNYRVAARERRITIGSFPDWSVKAARDQAKAFKREIDLGVDPMAEREEERSAQTVAALCDLFELEYLPNRRPKTREDYCSLIKLYIRPKLGRAKAAAVRPDDVVALHREIAARAPYQANRVLAVISSLMAFAIRKKMREDNPAKGIEQAPEEKRERYLSPEEIGRLGEALDTHPERTSANAIRLLLLTGARRGEVLSATWDQFDLSRGVWTKPSMHTKQKKVHRVPLSAGAIALLEEMKRQARPGARYVFPGRPKDDGTTGAPLAGIKRTWASVCCTAALEDVRIHDLRHSYASILASSGLSLQIVGALLGHTQPRTTARYAHLYDDVLRDATERVGVVVGRRPSTAEGSR